MQGQHPKRPAAPDPMGEGLGRHRQAITKLAQNLFGELYAKAYDMHIMMVRAFNHIGPGQLPQFVVSDFCKQVAAMSVMWFGRILC